LTQYAQDPSIADDNRAFSTFVPPTNQKQINIPREYEPDQISPSNDPGFDD
jgi:hypothetical protein